MDLTKVLSLYEEMGVMNNPIRIIPSPSSCGRNVGLSYGSPDYAIFETIDMGDMMMGLKRRESITIANNRLLSSLEAIASLKSTPQALCPSTKHHVAMMTKYSNPSPKSMMGSPLGKSRSSRRIFMGASLLSSEPKKSSRRVLMGSTPIYSAPSNNLFDPDLVASYEEAKEDISWDKNHKENEQQMQEVEKELSEVLCIYAPTFATTTRVDRNIYDPFLCFEEKCPPGGGNRILLYTTTLRGIRKTFENCNNARSIRHGFDLIIDERDVSMHLGFLNELRELMGRVVSVPRLFVKGQYIGKAS